MNEAVELFYRDGKSDKRYAVAIVADGDGYRVDFEFGRRGGSMQTGSKTPAAVPYAKAKQTFDALVREKMQKGYTPNADGTAFVATPAEARVSGHVPQLLNPIERDALERLIDDPDFVFQTKLDGERRGIAVDADGNAVGINRRGLTVALPDVVMRHVGILVGARRPALLDGEQIGDAFHVFDLLRVDGVDRHEQPLTARLAALEELCAQCPPCPAIVHVHTAASPKHKRALLAAAEANHEEGVVAKRASAPYRAGRPASGGNALKFKLTDTASVRVRAQNADRRSVALEALDAAGRWIEVGNVTIPPNTPIPDAGAIVECRYLYYFAGGALFQPVYAGVRTDVDDSDCRVDQLKVKREAG